MISTTPRHLDKSQLVKHHLADMLRQHLLVKTSEPVMLPSIEGMGAKLGEGMGASDFEPRHLTN